MELGLSGLASGFDWKSFITQISEVERAPQFRLASEQNTIRNRRNAYASIETDLTILKGKVDSLKSGDVFNARATSTSAEGIATASASSSAATGSYKINISQLATSSVLRGAPDIGAKLNATDDVSGLVLSAAALSVPVTAGTFTVNGSIVEVSTSDTLQDVFDAISTATGGSVTASYNSSTDAISLSSGSEVILGSSKDTSNFLQSVKLFNNGTGTVTSTSELGGVVKSNPIDSANFQTAVSDGGSGAGAFKINGVEIAFDASADSLTNIIDRINSSNAGVTASYDSVNDRMLLTNDTEGDLGVALEDVTGNFLQATGLSTGTLDHGDNLEYSINGGGTLVNRSNQITEDSSGIAGLTVNALAVGESTIGVKIDADGIKAALNGFISAYNSVQTLIDNQTASETNSEGKVTAGTLSGEREANELASELRKLTNGIASGLPGGFNLLANIGINGNGNDNKIAITNQTELDDAIQNNLSSLKDLFTDETTGIGSRLDVYLEKMVGDDGLVIEKQKNLGKQISAIDTQLTTMERIVQANAEAMEARFIAMETAQARISQQLDYLSKIGN